MSGSGAVSGREKNLRSVSGAGSGHLLSGNGVVSGLFMTLTPLRKNQGQLPNCHANFNKLPAKIEEVEKGFYFSMLPVT